jgi:hypothetical protein
MAAAKSVDAVGVLREQLESASPDQSSRGQVGSTGRPFGVPLLDLDQPGRLEGPGAGTGCRRSAPAACAESRTRPCGQHRVVPALFVLVAERDVLDVDEDFVSGRPL